MIAGVQSNPPWSEFVRLLRQEFDADHANIIFRRPDLTDNFITESSIVELSRRGDPHLLYNADIDPIPYFRMTPFKAYAIDEFIETRPQADHPFLANFLVPLGIGSVLICRATTQVGMQAWISLARRRDRPFAADARSGLQAIARLYAQILPVFGSLKEVEDQRDAYARVVRARATGFARIDQDGGILHLDENATTWTEEASLIANVGGRLQPTLPGHRARFAAAIENILKAQSDEEFLALEGAGGESIELLLYRTSDPLETAWTNAPRAIIYMRMAGRDPTPSPQRVRSMFGLSRREAALASLLARGLTVSEAARDLGISEQTARSYLRQVFQKTGVSRQAELIRKIQASIASL